MTDDLRLHGGQIFLHEAGLTKADLLVRDGKISGIVAPDALRDGGREAAETVDLRGAVVLPGCIDPHVHLGKDIRVPKDPDDALLESASAAAGGVTSMLVYLMSAEPYHDVFADARAAMDQRSHVDFGFHLVLGSDEHVESIPSYVRDLGTPSFKFFMNFRGDEGAYLGLPGNDDGFMYDLLGAAADHGAMVNPHPENIELVWRLRQHARQRSGGASRQDARHDADGPLVAWHRSRPPFVEAEAAHRVAYLASVTGASVYLVHTSSQAALDVARRQRLAYPNLFVETCAHYLTLSTASDCGTYGKVNPPLRPTSDVEALWQGLADGSVDTIGSDHNARHRSFKEKDIWSASAGFPGTGTVLPLSLGEGLRRGAPLRRLVDATSTRAARLFGLYPRKGVVRVGSDADLTVLDLDGSTQIRAEQQHSGAGYTPWEGVTAPVRVVHTLVRGHFAVRDGQLAAEPAGRYLPRERSGAAALAAADTAGSRETW